MQLDSRYLPLILDVIDQSIFTIDKHGFITFFNRAAEELTGYSSDEVLGKKCSDVFLTELCDRGCPLKQTIQSGHRMHDRRIHLQVKDRRKIPVAITTALLATHEGDVLGGVEIIKDLSSLEHLKRQLDGKYCFEDIISKNERMHRIFNLLPLVAQSDSSVLILGASGTGKELLAKAIHHQSNRRDKPFIAVNCAALPETLMESELFGYIKGAFTDAKRDKPGRIAQADGGTLFLDEVGDLSLPIQVKLLRFLQERVYEPLGATFSVRADVRILSATHQDLEQMVASDNFRRDLFYRLNVMQIDLPPLCERSDDIPLLTQHFIRRFKSISGKRIESLSDEAMNYLLKYSFPGNIRELENIIERAFILCPGPQILLDHLPANIIEQVEKDESEKDFRSSNTQMKPLEPLEQAERQTIKEALNRNKGNRSHAALDLGIHRSTLIRKIKLYGIVD